MWMMQSSKIIGKICKKTQTVIKIHYKHCGVANDHKQPINNRVSDWTIQAKLYPCL